MKDRTGQKIDHWFRFSIGTHVLEGIRMKSGSLHLSMSRDGDVTDEIRISSTNVDKIMEWLRRTYPGGESRARIVEFPKPRLVEALPLSSTEKEPS